MTSEVAMAQIRRIEEQVAHANQRADLMKSFQQRVEELRGTATSQRREVSVQVDSGGRLTDVEFTAGFAKLSTQEMADVFLRTLAAARKDAAATARILAIDTFGEDSPVTEQLLAAYERTMPAAPEETGAPPKNRGPILRREL
ncbi:MAG: YbaB/EbfC family nucleoid-associated protein [Schaalia hyovaginalis]|uniref:YbaB/EbfC family nucleoid-associated protein n=1 Tax=Schaalia hyovaginalis TaxID=29316 RepID=UPI002A90B4A3|nr:YbaB/EbfC family nucleoid-associated protein [Schaalia hyovaginalis]MDY6214737.1 YbaB/EbfC family nucleoid-associated protein [Schaalia hyovaginalis]